MTPGSRQCKILLPVKPQGSKESFLLVSGAYNGSNVPKPAARAKDLKPKPPTLEYQLPQPHSSYLYFLIPIQKEGHRCSSHTL